VASGENTREEEAGAYYADMALGDGFGALVSFHSSSDDAESNAEMTQQDETLQDDEPKEQDDNAASFESIQNTAGSVADAKEVAKETEAPSPEDFLLDAMGDCFGAILIDETQADANCEAAAESIAMNSKLNLPALGSLYPEVESWLAVTLDSEAAGTFKRKHETQGNIGRASFAQRIDRMFYPPPKRSSDDTLAKESTSKLEVDFPRDGRNHQRRRLIGTGLGSVAAAAAGAAGAVARTASKVTSASTQKSARTNNEAQTATLGSNQVLIWGATTVEGHYQRIRKILEMTSRGIRGANGLRAAGFEYRMVPCQKHKMHEIKEANIIGHHNGAKRIDDIQKVSEPRFIDINDKPDTSRVKRERSQSDAGISYGVSTSFDDIHRMIIVPWHAASAGDLVESAAIRERNVEGFTASVSRTSRRLSVSSETSLSTVFGNSDRENETEGKESYSDEEDKKNAMPSFKNNEMSSRNVYALDLDPKYCPDCFTRLFHIESNVLISEDNLNRFIANGSMYDEIARLCQEHAQEMMIEEGDLSWQTICDDCTKGNPVRAIVDKDHSKRPGPILLVITGKGKVRAGIFSRRHILTNGIECSTALPMVREAKRRKMKVAILDPNARGDREGMLTFEASVRALFGHKEWNRDGQSPEGHGPHTSEHFNPYRHESPMYILAHSSAGGQLVRYLMDQAHHLLPQIAAIVFTDSTHNIQWTNKFESLQRLLESPSCVYLRSSNVRNDDNWEACKAGDIVKTDAHWERRFGAILTLWAGTPEHSLTNWTSHHLIWSHFDSHIVSSGNAFVESFRGAIDQSMEENKIEAKENTEKVLEEGEHEEHSVSSLDLVSNDSAYHKRKDDRSGDLVTL